MSMLTRTGTTVRKHRRRSSGKPPRRGSAPTVLQPTSPSPYTFYINRSSETVNSSKPYLTPQPSPAKSVSFSFENNGRLSVTGQGENSSQSRSREASLSQSEKYYGSVVIWNDHLEADASFNFISGIIEASAETASACEFLYRAFALLSTTWPVTVLMGLMVILPLSMLVIGVKYLEDCPIQPKIPIYLVVGGTFGTMKLLLLLCTQIKRLKDDVEEDITNDSDLFTMGKMANVALTIFLAIWFGFGNYWIFKLWKPRFRPPLHEPNNWCDQTVFMFSFWQVIVCHILIGACVFLGVVFVCCFACIKFIKDDEKG